MAHCSASGHRAASIDDFVDRLTTVPDAVTYGKWKIDWLRRLDAQCISGRGTALVASQILLPTLDTFVIQARLLCQLVDIIDPDQVTVSGVPDRQPLTEPMIAGLRNGLLGFQYWATDPTLAELLLPLIGKERHFDVDVTPGPRPPAMAPNSDLRGRLGPRTRMGRLARIPLARLRQARLARLLGHRVLPPKATASLMCWSSGYGFERAARDEAELGQRVLLLGRGDATGIVDPSRWGLARVAGRTVLSTQAETATLPGLDELLTEVDDWCQVPAAGVLLKDRVSRFASLTCPEIERLADQFAPQLVRAHVSRVIAANPSSPEEFGVLLASSESGTTTVLVQHGDTPISSEHYCMVEPQNFEEMCLSDPTRIDLADQAASVGIHSPALHVSSPRIRSLPSRRTGETTRTIPVVAYVPVAFFGDFQYFGAGLFDDAWYCRWQLRLLDRFLNDETHHFLWKELPLSHSRPLDPIAAKLSSHPNPVVRLESRPFLSIAHEVDLFLTDYPSTALYEAAYIGLPCLGVAFDRFARLRPGAARLFGDSLRPCRDEDQALEAIDDFLTSGPQSHIVPLFAR
jgi:hypothetical protein